MDLKKDTCTLFLSLHSKLNVILLFECCLWQLLTAFITLVILSVYGYGLSDTIVLLTLWRPLLPYRYTWVSECPDVKNYKWRLNPVWHRMRTENSDRQRVNETLIGASRCQNEGWLMQLYIPTESFVTSVKGLPSNETNLLIFLKNAEKNYFMKASDAKMFRISRQIIFLKFQTKLTEIDRWFISLWAIVFSRSSARWSYERRARVELDVFNCTAKFHFEI